MGSHDLAHVLRRVLWAVGGLVIAAVALGMLSTGFAITHTFGPSGSVSTDSARLEGDGRALVSDGLSIAGGSPLQAELGTLTLSARSDDGKPLFIGLAREDEVFSYLDGVSYDVVSNVTATSATVRSVPGDAPVRPPESQTFWVRQASGLEPTIAWPSDAEGKGYRLVVMNVDGSPGVVAVLRLGFTSTSLPSIGVGSAVLGSVLLIPAIWMLYRAFRRRRQNPANATAALPPPSPADAITTDVAAPAPASPAAD